MILALLDGTIVPEDAPLIRATDLGLVRGVGAFEATLVVDGKPRDLERHLERFQKSARMLRLNLPPMDQFRHGIAQAIKAWNQPGEASVRWYATGGLDAGGPAGCWVTVDPISETMREQRKSGVKVAVLNRGYRLEDVTPYPWLLAGSKSLSYALNMAALDEAHDRGADDAVWHTVDNYVLEAPTSSVVIRRGKTLISPPTDGILDGITVERLFAAASKAGWNCEFDRILVSDVPASDGAWLTSSVRLMSPITEWDGQAMRVDDSVTRELAQLLWSGDVSGWHGAEKPAGH